MLLFSIHFIHYILSRPFSYGCAYAEYGNRDLQMHPQCWQFTLFVSSWLTDNVLSTMKSNNYKTRTKLTQASERQVWSVPSA